MLDGDGESRLLLTGIDREPLRHPSRTSSLPKSSMPGSDGRTRIGGMLRIPVLDDVGEFTFPQLPDAAKLDNSLSLLV